jgi:hypothetical protein
MAVNLADSWAKHERAMEHLGTLAIETDDYLHNVQVSAVVESTAGGVVEGEFEVDGQPAPRLGTIVGDVVHNLRSALDVAAWQLAIDHDETEARRRPHLVQFPLARDVAGFTAHNALPFFSEDARRVLESLQPYQRSNEALGWLRELSNSDKHRVATFSFAGMSKMPTGAEVGVSGFGGLEVRFGGEDGHLGVFGFERLPLRSSWCFIRSMRTSETRRRLRDRGCLEPVHPRRAARGRAT